jgi:DNA-binding SARP family transcriptional activator
MVAREPPTPALRIELLGSVRVSLGEQAVALGPPRRQAVLAVLALRANRTVSRDEIVDAVWGEDPPTSAVNGVHVHIAALRNLLEPGREHRRAARLVSTSGGGYRLRVSEGDLDVQVFEDHLRRGDALLAGGDPGAAVAAFDAGLGLWRGTPLAGVPGRLAEIERRRLTEERVAAREARA